MNAKKQDGGLNEWLLAPGVPHADIYVVGFQEIVDLNAMNVAIDGGKSQSRSNFWRDQVRPIVFSHYNYISLLGLFL